MTSTASTLWIGPLDNAREGDTGFLVRLSHETDGWERHDLRDTPAHTNRSHEPRLNGWCGTYNNLATYGAGFVRIERVAKNGRALVKQLSGSDLAGCLEALGYPELAGDVEVDLIDEAVTTAAARRGPVAVFDDDSGQDGLGTFATLEGGRWVASACAPAADAETYRNQGIAEDALIALGHDAEKVSDFINHDFCDRCTGLSPRQIVDAYLKHTA